MARLLAEGTGAAWAQVWLWSADEPELAATWPPERRRDQRARVAGPGAAAAATSSSPARPSACSVSRSDPTTRPDAGRGAAVRRSRRPGRPGAARCAAARRAGAAGDELARPGRRAPGSRGSGSSTRTTRATPAGARHPRRGPAAPGRAGRQPRLAQTLAGASPDRAQAVLAEQADAVDDAIATWSTCPAGSTRRALTEDGVGGGAARRRGRAPVPSRSRCATTASAACRRRSRPRSTSAASRRSRTPSSTPTRHVGSTVDLARTPDGRALVVSDDGHGFDVRRRAGAARPRQHARPGRRGGVVGSRLQPRPGTAAPMSPRRCRSSVAGGVR